LNVPEAAPNTVGVIPSDFSSSYYGAVQIHDFAGHEEYHGNHELLFQNSLFPVVLIAVDLRNNVLGELHYWCNILSNSLSHSSHSKQCTANVVVIGSHYDRINGKSALKGLGGSFEAFFQNQKYIPTIMYSGFVTLDCRKPISPGMQELRKLLQQLCRSSRTEMMKMSNFMTAPAFKKLEDFMNTHYADAPAVTMEDLCEKARSMSFIPDTVSSSEELFHMCERLSLLGVILLLRDEKHQGDSIVVRKEDSILHQIHSRIASMQQDDFRLVPFSQLREAFEDSDIRPNIAIGYLKYAQICTEVSPEVFTEPPQLLAQEKYYFFPSFINKDNEKPSGVPPPPSSSSTAFYTWYLKCEEPMTPRFLQVLFAQLTGVKGSPRLTLWVNGMFIVNNDSTEVLIEITEAASKVMLQIRCKQSKEFLLLRRRSQLIFLITDLLKRNCPKLSYSEYVVEPQNSQSPDQPMQTVPLSDVAKAVIEDLSTVAVYSEQNPIACLDLNTLLFFEPLQSLSTKTLKCLIHCPNEMVPNSVVQRFLHALEHNCPGASQPPLTSQSTTYQQLYDVVKEISIFTVKNIWVRDWGVEEGEILIYVFRHPPASTIQSPEFWKVLA
jgi:hypothetical protein